MYCHHFGFSEKPFDVTPDPKFLYLSPSHREMLASLVYGIGERRGFIALVGEVGTGKTTLINAALDRLGGNTSVAYIGNTALSFDQLLYAILQELGLVERGEKLSKIEAIQTLNDFAISRLSEGGNVVVIVDEAQDLDGDSMENFRLLSNLETRKHKLIQIVLSGQPELDEKLDRPDLRQLAQRINVRRSIYPLTEKETKEYIRHRLSLVHYEGPYLFSGGAEKIIYEVTGGIPRKINILCDNAFLIAYALRKRKIDEDCILEAARDLGWSSAPVVTTTPNAVETPAADAVTETRRIGLGPVFAVIFALMACISVGVWAFFTYSGYTLKLQEPMVVKQSVQNGAAQERAQLSIRKDLNARRNEDRGPGREALMPPGTGTTASAAVLPLPDTATPPQETDEAPAGVEPRNGGNPSLEPRETVSSVSELEPKEPKDPAQFARRAVTVERGDTLAGIIRNSYGIYNRRLLALVLRENPDIGNPDQIEQGQVIRLPERE